MRETKENKKRYFNRWVIHYLNYKKELNNGFQIIHRNRAEKMQNQLETINKSNINAK